MPSEVRRIEFSEIEVIKALSLYKSKILGRTDRPVNVTNVKVSGGEEFTIVAKVPCETQGLKNHVFDYNACMGVFLLYAKSIAIPLPRQGKKSLLPTDHKGVVMTIKHQLPSLTLSKSSND